MMSKHKGRKPPPPPSGQAWRRRPDKDINGIPSFELPAGIQYRVDLDGAFFTQHPDMWEFLRPAVPGEFIDENGYPVPWTGQVHILRLTVEDLGTGPGRARFMAGTMPHETMRLLRRVQADLRDEWEAGHNGKQEET